jgi:hypothetical protein
MQKLFIHQRRTGSFIADPEGSLYRDIEDALDDAEWSARDLMSERIRNGELPDDSSFEITDQAGVVVATYSFNAALTAPNRSVRPRSYSWLNSSD